MREAIGSNAIEGTYAEVADVLLEDSLGLSDRRPQTFANLEVLLYRNALEDGERWLDEGRPISLSFVKGLHQQLLAMGRGSDKTPGAFREKQVLVGSEGDSVGSARFVPPPSEHVGPLMENLVGFMVDETEYPILIACALAHYQFETVHPFEDGNGRIGRLLIPLYLKAHGVIERPILYLSSYLEAHRNEYFDRLKRVSTHGDWSGWLHFFLEAVTVQAVDSRSRVERLLNLQEGYREMVRLETRSQTPLVAIDLLLASVFMTIPELSKYASCSYGAAKSAVETLSELGILSALPGSYPSRWVASELLNVAYEG